MKNSATLLSGRIITDILSLASLALVARSLGPSEFGQLVLIQTFVAVADGLVNFQSWQALVKYGADKLSKNSIPALRGLVRLCSILDILSSCTGTILAVFSAEIIGRWLDWDEHFIRLVQLYSLAIVTNLQGAPLGILRLFDRFGLYASITAGTSCLKLVMVGIALYLKIDLAGFVIIFLACEVIANLSVWAAGWRVIHKEAPTEKPDSISVVREKNQDIVSFFFTTNWHGSVRITTREFDLLLIASLLSSQAVGVFKIVKQISSVLARVGDPLYQAIYPEIAKILAKKRVSEVYHLIQRSFILGFFISVASWFGLLFFGKFFIELILGGEYISAHITSLIYMLAVVIAVSAFAFQPLMLALGRPQQSFRILIFATTIYFLTLVPLTQAWGINGAALSYLLFTVIQISVMGFFIKKYLLEERQRSVS